MNNYLFLKWLDVFGACDEAKDWVRSKPDLGLYELWQICERGDWMIWLLNMTSKLNRETTYALCIFFARRAEEYAKLMIADQTGKYNLISCRLYIDSVKSHIESIKNEPDVTRSAGLINCAVTVSILADMIDPNNGYKELKLQADDIRDAFFEVVNITS